MREVSSEIKGGAFKDGVASTSNNGGGQRGVSYRATNVARGALGKMDRSFLFFVRRVTRRRLRKLRNRVSENVGRRR